MSDSIIKARKWQVLAIPFAIALTGVYLIGAWCAGSINPKNVVNEILSQGYSLILLVIAAAQFLFLEFADGRLTGLAFNRVGVQALYFNDENKWIDWDDIQSLKKTYTKLKITDQFQTHITIPLLKFSANDRKRIQQYLNKYSATTQ